MVLWVGPQPPCAFVYGDLTLFVVPFQYTSTSTWPVAKWTAVHPLAPLNPDAATSADSSATPVWTLPLSLATTRRIFSSPPGTKMFQFPDLPPQLLLWYPGFPWVGFPIRIPPDLRPHTTPRGFSQCATPFFGVRRLGIHRAPFFVSAVIQRSCSSLFFFSFVLLLVSYSILLLKYTIFPTSAYKQRQSEKHSKLTC